MIFAKSGLDRVRSRGGFSSAHLLERELQLPARNPRVSLGNGA